MSIYVTYKDCVREFYFSNVDMFQAITIDEEIGTFDVKWEWSFSFDNSTWSTLTSNKAQFLTELQAANQFNVKIYVKSRLTISHTANTQAFACYLLNDVKFGVVSVRPTSVVIVNNNSVLNNTKTKNLMNPYRQSEAQKQLYDKLSKSVSDIFGFECIWFRTEQSSPNITFKTYQLSHVIENKLLKVVIRGNEIPDNKLRFTELDIDFQDELELHIVKEVFEETFGVDKKPNSNDYLWLPLTNRMYQVNTVYDAKTFMQHAPFYKAILVKYENRASVVKSDEINDTIDELITYEDLFEQELLGNEIENAERTYNQPKADDISTNNISDDTVVTDTGIAFRWSYNWQSISNANETKVYEMQPTSHQWSNIMWVQFGSANCQIFKLTDSIDRTVQSLTRTGQQLTLDISSMTQQLSLVTMSITDELLTEDKFYGIVVNYVCNDAAKLVTVTVCNDQFEVIREIAISDEKLLSVPVRLALYGGNRYASIRMKRQIVRKASIADELSNELPEIDNYLLIDNAMPVMTEPKTTC